VEASTKSLSKDLKDRFGKFGNVEDMELRTRKDEDILYKTFGYININISDADLKKCLTVLNKSKWKGGTLQTETRLYQPAAGDQKQMLLESLSKVGVENFTMKAAVPGTEIPGHKDWVVSKFGRVLPVLQLRSQKGSRAPIQILPQHPPAGPPGSRRVHAGRPTHLAGAGGMTSARGGRASSRRTSCRNGRRSGRTRSAPMMQQKEPGICEG
uniref:RRM domain-containing protein n=1 Tax=Amphiprion percula TaxID=161767 RepID=A0A3P8U2H6_AMPPE